MKLFCESFSFTLVKSNLIASPKSINLKLLLDELGVNTVIMTGLHAHMCVRHTSADAYQYGYDIVVASDATDSFTEEDYIYGIKYLKDTYGAEISDVDSILAML